MAKIQTVLGNINPQDLGRTLTHEHLAMTFAHFYREPPTQLNDKFGDQITLSQVGYLRQYPYSSKYNLNFEDADTKKAVLNDVKYYKKYGGGTIVENSTIGLNRDIDFLKLASKETGVHIVPGTGYYIADVQTPGTLNTSQEDMYNFIVKELTEGCAGHPGVKAGFIGEVASVWPIKDFERSAIRATAEAQAQVQCGVSFHPHRVKEAPFEIMRLYLEAGGKADKAVMSHLDRTLDKESLLDFAALGAYNQLDLFGVEVSYYQLHTPTNMPSDSQRMDLIQQLIDDGREDRILMSHDIHTKHRLADFGGHGYSHIINNVLPRLRTRGISQQTIDKITITNPATWLSMPVS